MSTCGPWASATVASVSRIIATVRNGKHPPTRTACLTLFMPVTSCHVVPINDRSLPDDSPGPIIQGLVVSSATRQAPLNSFPWPGIEAGRTRISDAWGIDGGFVPGQGCDHRERHRCARFENSK